MSLGAYLKNARGDKTIGQISAISGIDKGYLSKIERDIRNPKPGMLVKLASAYGVKFNDLILIRDNIVVEFYNKEVPFDDKYASNVSESIKEFQKDTVTGENNDHNKKIEPDVREACLSELNDIEWALIKKYRTLDRRGKNAVEVILNYEYNEILKEIV